MPIPTKPFRARLLQNRGFAVGLAQQLIESQDPELIAAIRAGAQARVNQLKAQLSNQVANAVAKQLNRSFSFYVNWIDPLIGLRGFSR